MSLSVLRTADAWWVSVPSGAAKVTTTATTTAELLADRPALDAAGTGDGGLASTLAAAGTMARLAQARVTAG